MGFKNRWAAPGFFFPRPGHEPGRAHPAARARRRRMGPPLATGPAAIPPPGVSSEAWNGAAFGRGCRVGARWACSWPETRTFAPRFVPLAWKGPKPSAGPPTGKAPWGAAPRWWAPRAPPARGQYAPPGSHGPLPRKKKGPAGNAPPPIKRGANAKNRPIFPGRFLHGLFFFLSWGVFGLTFWNFVVKAVEWLDQVVPKTDKALRITPERTETGPEN
jgi:hypothetical protein